MADLYIYNNKIDSVFQLLGQKENDISYSVGWALANSPTLLTDFLRKTINWKKKLDFDQVKIMLQKYERKKGFTDFEIELPGHFHLIIEAKKGWKLPSIEQLKKYVSRHEFSKSIADIKKVIVLTECSQHFMDAHFNINQVDGIDVLTLSWKDIYELANANKGTNAEKRLLRQIKKYLEKIMTMQKKDSNWVYIVSLGYGKPKHWEIGWREIVNDRHNYFHPVGNRWPAEPPNYIAFRYNGKLQSIHHIEKYIVFTNPHDHFPEIPSKEWEPHFLYSLGQGFCSTQTVKNGKVYPSGRYWCMLDTLFICETISDARDVSMNRMNE